VRSAAKRFLRHADTVSSADRHRCTCCAHEMMPGTVGTGLPPTFLWLASGAIAL
jgi:hypothetical protein